jgi:hypothetical protein
MNAPSIWCALLVSSAATLAFAQPARGDAVGRGEFLRNYPAGSIALVSDISDDIAKVKKLIVLPSVSPIEVRRRARCLVAISHRDIDRAGETTFVGVQLIRFFSDHNSPGAVYTARNSGWVSAIEKRHLPEVPAKELVHQTLSNFAAAHATAVEPKVPALFGDARTAGWHALASSDEESYSGSEEHRRFWAVNPLEDDVLKRALSETAQTAKDVRVENRLYRFALTEAVSSSNMPNFGFTCADARLMAVAMRIYRPFASEPSSWGFIKFK